MGKSKSHPCRHPQEAERSAMGFIGVVWCHKCKQHLDMLTDEVVKPEDLIAAPATIMEGSPSGT